MATVTRHSISKRSEDRFRVTLALAGFRPEEVEIVAEQNQLVVTGRKAEDEGAQERYLHHGIAARSSEGRFQLADYIEVRCATFENGLLAIVLQREIPEALKPRRIEISPPANDGGLLPKLKNKIKAI